VSRNLVGFLEDGLELGVAARAPLGGVEGRVQDRVREQQRHHHLRVCSGSI